MTRSLPDPVGSAARLLLMVAWVGWLSVRPAAAQGGFSPTGRLADTRAGHTATLLPSGKVLVAGGAGNSGYLAKAELYDPGSGTWTSTGSLVATRQGHTATLLPTGKVLVVGGAFNNVSLASAELYDPTAGTWTATGSLGAGRFGHIATLLPNGKVLVAGGFASGFPYTPLASAETYDPASGAWTSVGPLAFARGSFTATLLRSGKVLVAGGYDGSDYIASAELYDPAAGTWTTTGPLGQVRESQSSTLLASGTVLVASGSTAELYDPASGMWTATGSLAVTRYGRPTATLLASGKVLVVYGTSGELYDPATGSWTVAGSLSVDFAVHTATLLPNGEVLIAGGYNAAYLSNAELYDPGSGGWTATGPLANTRSLHTATLLPSGKALVAGGVFGGALRCDVFDACVPLASGELYDPAGGTWTAKGGLGVARYGATATLLATGKVLVAGGAGGGSSAELYDPTAGTWTATGAMGVARNEHTATLLPGGKVMVVGGFDTGASLASVELYDPASGTWTATGSLTAARVQHTATLLPSGEVLVVGGYGQGYLTSAELYDPASGTWTTKDSLAFAHRGHTATLLPDGRVLVAGGENRGQYISASELYDPTTGTWTATGALATGRRYHTATLLPRGKVLVAGGESGFGGFAASAEEYDPASGKWATAGSLAVARAHHTATLLPSGRVLMAGGYNDATGNLASEELYDPYSLPLAPDRHPSISSAPATIQFGTPFNVVGHFRGDSEASGGGTQSSPVNYPMVAMRSLETGRRQRLRPDPRANFWDDPMTLSFSDLPASLDPGWHVLSVGVAGVESVGVVLSLQCTVGNPVITANPQSLTVTLNQTATFAVQAQGARRYQWEQDGVPIPGATGPSYTTPPVTAALSGTKYRAVVTGACPTATATSAELTLTVADSTPPTAGVVSPSGGEYWLLSPSGGPARSEQVTWSMSDDVRICRVAVSLLFSNDGGASYQAAAAGGGLPATYGSGGSCAYPGVTTSNLTYSIPTPFPSGVSGSLYKIEVVVSDQTGLPGHTVTARSPNPFYIVQSNPDSVRTLILSNVSRMQSRMGVTGPQAAALGGKLQELASNPKVQGLVVDLNGVTDMADLYGSWDADSSNSDKANAVLFGCHSPYPAGCLADRPRIGIHDELKALLSAYTGVRYVVLVGDDRIIPFARVADNTALLPESNYTTGSVDLTPAGTTVGQALTANKYLSDDPLVVLDPVASNQLNGNLFLPDLSVGRLVETPAEITAAIATFIGQDGVLDLTSTPANGNKVLVTGYDFLQDSASDIRKKWKSALGVSTPDGSLAPVDGSLVGGAWSDGVLRSHLGGNGAARYGVTNLNGHATHYAEGAPSADFRFGLKARDIYGPDACATAGAGAMNLSGGVIYAVGCHGGLPVPGTCAQDADHSLDLPQTFLSRGVMAYVANSGYGWGLKYGVGYGERLVEILTDEMTSGGTVVVGDAVRLAKQRYFLDTPRYDSYDEKSLMEWTVYGLPMYAVKTGVQAGASAFAGPSFQGKARTVAEGVTIERVGKAVVTRRVATTLAAAPPPGFLTQVNLHFDFTATGVYQKKDSVGGSVATPGCSDPHGCYYTLNGLSTGNSDLPIQPYFIYDSRLSGTSQHGVLWKGGTYDQESGWVPVIAELVSNGGDGSNHGNLPRKIMIRATSPRVVPGQDPAECAASDLEVNSTVVGAGEASKASDVDPAYSIERRYRGIDLEMFYFNDTTASTNNCDRTGPVFGTPPFNNGQDYHQASPGLLRWSVPASDPSGVWRVIVVVNDNSVDGSGRGHWVPVDLSYDGGSGTFVGSHTVGAGAATYVVEAVDNRGNLTWLDYQPVQLPSSGVALGIPNQVDVAVPAPTVLSVTGFSPPGGLPGTGVLITGTGFLGATGVAFNGSLAPFFVSSDGVINALVPSGATTGPISVTTPQGTAASAQAFSVGDTGGTATLSIEDTVVTDGQGAPTKAFFTVSLSSASAVTVAVDYATHDGTAVAGLDYTAKSGTLIFSPGTSVQYVTVPVRSDQTLDSTKTFFVDLSNPAQASLLRSRGEGWILDSAPGQTVQFSAAGYVVSEGATKAVIGVQRKGGTTGKATVAYSVSAGTGSAGVRYQSTSGTLTFRPGLSAGSFVVPLINDLMMEGSQTALLRLSSPTGAALGAQSTAVLTIGDNDSGGVVSFGAPGYTVKESGGQATIAVKRKGGLASGVEVSYATSDGTGVEGADYTGTSGAVTFGTSGLGAATQSFKVDILDDHTLKGDKTVNLTLSDATGGATLGTPSTARLLIQSDDPIVQFSAEKYTVAQAGKQAVITVKRSGPTTGTLTVGYQTSAGTAIVGTDYSEATGSLTFNPGILAQAFKVPVMDSGMVQGSKTVNLALDSPGGGAALGVQSEAVLTIVTDDSTVAFGKPNFAVTETTAAALIAVKRAPAKGTLTVGYATSDGTAVGGENYTPASGVLTFATGVSTKTFPVPIRKDSGHATGETVNLALGPVTGGLLGTPKTAVLTITDSTPAGKLRCSAADYSVSETGPVATITVTRTNGTAGGITVDYATSEGTALAGTNYVETQGTLVLADGELSKSFGVTILDDNAASGNKALHVTLSNPTGGAQLDIPTTATLWIVENK